MATTTIDTDTELSAVNSILGAIGQSPVTTLNYENPEVSFIYNILNEINKDVQNEGWHFNTEPHVEIKPDANKNLVVPTNTLRYTLHDGLNKKTQDLVVKAGKLYDMIDHTFVFDNPVYLDIVTLYPFSDLPNPFQRYITYRAAVRAATQLVSNPSLAQLLAQDEAKSRASCIDYECDMGNPSYFGFPRGHGTTYNSYQPYTTLRR
tara:strand:+ start:179 stop:796 length:618 start_codon:yes stop_codon:yes gene_type:complete